MSLAQELIDTIVDFCSDDFPTLAHLSLVSQRMRETSARHLYSHFDFTEETDSPTLTTLAQILTTSPHLALYIGHLILYLDFLFTSSSPPGSSEESVELKLANVHLIFALALRIEKLEIICGDKLETETLSSGLERLAIHTYEWLHLTHLCVFGPVPIFPAMGVRSNIESLTVSSSYCSQRMWDNIEAERGRFVRLKELVVNRVSDNVHGRELFGPRSPVDLSQLRTLIIRPQRVLLDGMFPRLLDHVSQTLEVFHLDLSQLTLDWGMAILLRLPLPRMHTLQITLPLLYVRAALPVGSKYVTQHGIDCAVSMLGGLSYKNQTTSLATIVIELPSYLVNPESIQELLDFRRLDQVLTRIADHGRLREIRIAFPDFERQKVPENFWKTLLETDFRGISDLKGVVLTLQTTY